MLHLGWMHNRVRMIVASFLVKDLHIEWTVGARYFMQHLVDGDLPSNNHGWQWVAGTGTDPAPYFRIFNPVTQGRKFDPDGDYVRRWVPELRGVDRGGRPRAVDAAAAAGGLPGADRRPRRGAGGGAASLRRGQVTQSGRIPQRPDHSSPGSRTAKPAWLLKASGAQVIGSTAMAGRSCSHTSGVNTWRWVKAESHQSAAPPADVRRVAVDRRSAR